MSEESTSQAEGSLLNGSDTIGGDTIEPNTLNPFLESIADSLNSIALVLENSSAAGFWEAIGVTVVGGASGAFAAYLFNVLHWRHTVRRSGIEKSVLELKSLLESLERDSLDYWLNSYSNENSTELTRLAIQVKSAHRIVLSHAHTLKKQLDDAGIQKKYAQEVDDFVADIFDIVTGDSFESKSHKESKTVAAQISRKCSQARAKLTGIASL